MIIIKQKRERKKEWQVKYGFKWQIRERKIGLNILPTNNNKAENKM